VNFCTDDDYFICNGKHTEIFPIVVGGHIISMNIPPRKEEGYYTYSLRVRDLKSRDLTVPPTLQRRQKNLPLPSYTL
jgi:hypothetical protein